MRRGQRTAARDAKCFAFADPENVPSAAPIFKKPVVPFNMTLAYALLSRECKGPSLSDLFLGGTMLSIPASMDLKEMLSGEKEQPEVKQSGKKASLKPKTLCYLHKGAKPMRAKMTKTPGAAARMFSPKVKNAFAGKRRC